MAVNVMTNKMFSIRYLAPTGAVHTEISYFVPPVGTDILILGRKYRVLEHLYDVMNKINMTFEVRTPVTVILRPEVNLK